MGREEEPQRKCQPDMMFNVSSAIRTAPLSIGLAEASTVGYRLR